MKIGIVVYSNDPETAWNAFRFANFALKTGDKVRVFLIGKGVESEKLEDPGFNVVKQMKEFIDAGGSIYACGTCLKLRKSQGMDLCPLSTMKDLYSIIEESDKILSF